MAQRKRHSTASSMAPRRVVVALRMAGIAGQDKLNGIFDYLSAGRRWQLIIYRTRQEFTADTVASELAHGADGFIAGIPGTDDALSALADSTSPTVIMNIGNSVIDRRTENIVFVKSDSAAVGHEGANALLQQGVYKSYGYAGYKTDDEWSHERGDAFRNALCNAGFDVSMLDVSHCGDKVEDKATVVEWLAGLPKPCGILAACDDRAFELLDICRETGIKVPAEVGIIGVNNDPLLCENATPRLSSIQPDFIEEGRLAAEILDKMMSGGAAGARLRKVGIRSIIHRESTVARSEAGKFVQKVLSYINREATKGIGVEDVAKHFKVSRSLLELRFRELQRESVYNAMLRIRLEEVKRRLRCTSDPIADITAACGWVNPVPPKMLFKKRFGVSMRDWRKARHPKNP